MKRRHLLCCLTGLLIGISAGHAAVECVDPEMNLAVEKEIENAMGGIQIAQFEAVARNPRPRLLRFPTHAHALVDYVEQLRSTFQIYKIAERPEDVTRHALRIGHRHNPYARELIPLCSGTFTSAQTLTTASHCLRSKSAAIEEIHILRRYNFVVIAGMLKVRGYQDYRIAAGSIERQGDLVRARVVGEVPGPYLGQAELARVGSDQLSAIGYPSNSHGRPVISLNCARPSYINAQELTSSVCPVLGGMSGGPVISEAGGQVGVVSMSSEDNLLTFPSIYQSN